MSKPKKTKWVDDGRVIASMDSVGDLRSTPLGRPVRPKRPFDPFGQIAAKKESVTLTPKERRSIISGVMVAHGSILLVMLVLAVILYFLMPT